MEGGFCRRRLSMSRCFFSNLQPSSTHCCCSLQSAPCSCCCFSFVWPLIGLLLHNSAHSSLVAASRPALWSALHCSCCRTFALRLGVAPLLSSPFPYSSPALQSPLLLLSAPFFGQPCFLLLAGRLCSITGCSSLLLLTAARLSLLLIATALPPQLHLHLVSIAAVSPVLCPSARYSAHCSTASDPSTCLFDWSALVDHVGAHLLLC